jgi:hypothetical protein
MKHPFFFNQFIAMILSHQISKVFMQNINRLNRVGSKAERPERETESSILVEREREHWLKLELARVLKPSFGKLNTRVFLSMQINRTDD